MHLVSPSDSGLFLLSSSVALCPQTRRIPAYFEQQRWQGPVEIELDKEEGEWQLPEVFPSYASVLMRILSKLSWHSKGLGTCTDAWCVA